MILARSKNKKDIEEVNSLNCYSEIIKMMKRYSKYSYESIVGVVMLCEPVSSRSFGEM